MMRDGDRRVALRVLASETCSRTVLGREAKLGHFPFHRIAALGAECGFQVRARSAGVKGPGLILAGGRSSRFGAEKAVALFDGEPMIARVARALLTSCGAVAVNAREGSGAAAWAAANGHALLPDAPGDHDGPLAGVRQGLRWAAGLGARVLVVAPCDTPQLPHATATRLLEGLATESAAYAVSSEGAHPLCCAWRIDRLAPLEAVLAEGHPSVRRLLDSWGAARIEFPDARAFSNVNTPAEASSLARTAP